MVTLARRIDSSLNSRIQALLQQVEMFNAFLQFFNSEMLVPVGSSQDGSKVNVPGDGGDVDILLISKTAILDESLLEYDPRYPAFLRVRGDSTHSEMFKWKRLVEDMYVPVNVLKHLERRIYGLLRVFVSVVLRPGISTDGEYFNVFKESAVGLEIAALDGSSTMDALHVAEASEKRVNRWSVMLKFVHSALDSFDAMANKCDPHDFSNAQSQRPFSNIAEGVTSAGIKIADLYRDLKENDGVSTMRNEAKKREPKTDPIYRSSISNVQLIGETSDLPKLMTADIVPAFTIQGWPRVAEEWITRPRKWPSKNLVLNIIKTDCQIVAKRPLYPNLNGDRNNEDHSPETDENDTCFRLSFSQCELALAKQLSEVPLLCWKILKAYQKAFLRTEPPVLTSYHWKTVLFFIREDTDDDFWCEGNLLNCVIRALDFMLSCLKARFLPGYFVRGENLIAGCRDDLVIVILNKVAEIRKSPSQFLLIFLEDPPKPDVYIISKEKIMDYLCAERQENMEEDICNNIIHGMWSFMTFEPNEDKNNSNEDHFDSFGKRYPENFRNFVQLIKGKNMNNSGQLILTGVEALMETVFSLDKEGSESDNENEQDIYAREQRTQYTKEQDSQTSGMPLMANEQSDKTAHTTADTADYNKTSAIVSRQSTRQSEKSLSRVKMDVEHNEYPQRVKDKAEYQIPRAEYSNTSTKQHDDSFSRKVETGVKFVDDFVRLVSKRDDLESDEEERESGSDLLSFAGNFIEKFRNKLSEEKANNHDNMNDSCKTNTSERAPCDLDLD
ncbi:uncharacterized protein LOC127851551 [Dreissena polymorpha]|uniref:Mab-21-like nucleotidyltransferase domain-containing protein n=1 Tax=Dreissena polymorpha TaxID=45954 RepID=A0A9D4NAQ9_DREPO|nr:uncharacterized protein LOC127851551 [Dreissena polymorpha]KAH3890334.1 hypothetical protein DPMN_014412 [Dreissena polymorpha]